MQDCDAWEYSTNPVLQKSRSSPGMPVLRGPLQKTWDSLSISLGNGLGSRTISSPQEAYEKSPKRCLRSGWRCRTFAIEVKLRERSVWPEEGTELRQNKLPNVCKADAKWHNVSLYLLQIGE